MSRRFCLNFFHLSPRCLECGLPTCLNNLANPEAAVACLDSNIADGVCDTQIKGSFKHFKNIDDGKNKEMAWFNTFAFPKNSFLAVYSIWDGEKLKTRGLLLLSKREITQASATYFPYLTGKSKVSAGDTVDGRGYLRANVRKMSQLCFLILDLLHSWRKGFEYTQYKYWNNWNILDMYNDKLFFVWIRLIGWELYFATISHQLYQCSLMVSLNKKCIWIESWPFEWKQKKFKMCSYFVASTGLNSFAAINLWETNYVFNVTARKINRELFVLGDFNNGPDIPECNVNGELQESYDKIKSLG